MLLVIVLCAAYFWRAREVPEEPLPPNVLLVMTDDQGYGDFSGMGNPVLETPRLDGFARECPQVERFYVSPVCAPTRASLLTGRYNYRTRVVDTYRGRAQMEPDEVTLAEALRGSGYRTGIFGKWHLGDAHPMRAMDQGFEDALVHRGGGLAQPSEPPENGRRYTDPLLEQNGRWFRATGYCTDVYVDEALMFMDESIQNQRPFFAYVATNAPHDPFHDVPEELYKKYSERDLSAVQIEDGTDADVIARTYAMIENADRNFGRLLDFLDDRGVADDTIVVFLVDNGPVRGRWNAGLRGGKTTVYEGGIRSPLWIRWPGHLSPETVVDAISAHIDIMPTLLQATGTPEPTGAAFDGKSLLPLLEGKDVDWPDRHLVIQSHRGDVPERDHNCAIIGETWKLVRASGYGQATAGRAAQWQLYDIDDDPGEADNRIAKEMGRVIEMRTVYDDWYADVSTTREDNYAPPRIQPGTDLEPTTALTWQDWRSDSKPGWGTGGWWELRFGEAVELDLTLRFKEERAMDLVYVTIGDEVHGRAVEGPGATLPIGRFAFPAGDVRLSIECRSGDESFDAYQVVLKRPR